MYERKTVDVYSASDYAWQLRIFIVKDTWLHDKTASHRFAICVKFASFSLLHRILYGNKISDLPQGIFRGLTSLQLLWV